MAKMYGLFGSMKGKLADVVMAVRNGEQIARKYQPSVYNPNTPAQIATRAKLKLLSQLSAIVAPVIAIPRKGSVSTRNLFFKKNYDAVSYAQDEASVDMLSVKITDSVVPLPTVSVTRNGNEMTVELASGDASINRIVYVLFSHIGDEVRLANSTVVSDPGAALTYPTSFAIDNVEYYVYAYGVRDNTEAARVKFGNMNVPSAADLAKLIVNRTLTENDVTLTETKAVKSAQVVGRESEEHSTKKTK